MPRTLFLVALLLISQTTSKPRKLPVDKFPFALRAHVKEVQSAWDQYPENACILYQVAALYAKSGDKKEALAILGHMADKHAGLDPRVRDGFDNLASDPDFLALKKEIRRDNPPVRNARQAFSIAEGDLLSEGIAWSANQKRFYLGSAKRKIISVDEDGNAQVF